MITVTFNGTQYEIPETSDSDWGDDLTSYFTALPQGCLQKTGGNFVLTADANFGGAYGLISQYFKSRSSNISSTGVVRLSNADFVSWRNAANDGDLPLEVNGSDLLEFNSVELVNLSANQTLTNKTLTSPTINTPTLTVNDDGFTIQDESDTTKKAKFDAASISTETTRTFTLPNADTTLVGTDVTQTLTGKTIDADNNTISNIANDNIKSAAGIALDKLENIATNSILGRDTADSGSIEVLSGADVTALLEDFTGDSGSGGVKGLVPAPEAGDAAAGYALKADGSWGPVGTVSPLTTKGDLYGYTNTDARVPVGIDGQKLISNSNETSGLQWQTDVFKNYILNSNAEASITGYSAYSNTPGVAPVSGDGGSPVVTVTRSTSSPLVSPATILITKDAADRQGEGVAYTFDIDPVLQGQAVRLSFDYLPSADFVSGDSSDVRIYIIPQNGSDTTVAQTAPYTIQGGAALSNQFIATYQVPADCTQLRVCWHIATTNASAWTFKINNVYFGNQIVNYGYAGTDWETATFTGSWSTNTTYTGKRRYTGDSVEYQINLALAGAPTSASLTINIPDTIDTNKLTATTAKKLDGSTVAIIDASPAERYVGDVFYSSTTAVAIRVSTADSTYSAQNNVTQAVPVTFASGDSINISFKVPVVGRSSNVLMSSDAATRLVAMKAIRITSGQTFAAGATDVICQSVKTDTHGTYNSTTGVYTCPVTGLYDVDWTLLNLTGGTSPTSQTIYVQQGGSGTNQVATFATFSAQATNTWHGRNGSGKIFCRAGDTLKLVISNGGQSTSGDYSSSNNSDIQSFAVSLASGPSSIAATDTVGARYFNSSSSVSGSYGKIVWATKDYDYTGNSMVSGTFTAPVAGLYSVKAKLRIAGTYSLNGYANIAIYKNGSLYSGDGDFAGGSQTSLRVRVEDEVRLLAGQTIEIYVQSDAGSPSISSSDTFNSVAIALIGNY